MPELLQKWNIKYKNISVSVVLFPFGLPASDIYLQEVIILLLIHSLI